MQISRGNLKLPPYHLYDLSLYYFAFFKARKVKCCTKIFLEAFNLIYDSTGYKFDGISRINRRLINFFFKAMAKKSTVEVGRQKDQRQTKKRLIASSN